jgi:hypothetical protein
MLPDGPVELSIRASEMSYTFAYKASGALEPGRIDAVPTSVLTHERSVNSPYTREMFRLRNLRTVGGFPCTDWAYFENAELGHHVIGNSATE